MKNIIITFILSTVLFSCEKPYKKPFIITSRTQCSGREVRYDYVDADKNIDFFYDLCDKYSVGDTLK